MARRLEVSPEARREALRRAVLGPPGSIVRLTAGQQRALRVRATANALLSDVAAMLGQAPPQEQLRCAALSWDGRTLRVDFEKARS